MTGPRNPMRWIPFLILAYLTILLQTTLGRVLMFSAAGIGTIGPDLAALLAVFVAFYVRTWADAMLAGWALGMAVDLTAVAGVGAGTVVGPMAIAYALVAGLLFRVREAFFRERAVTQAFLAWAFCLLAHGAWVSMQALLVDGPVGWPEYGRTMLQAVGLACYSAVLMPLMHFLLMRCQRWLLAAPVGPGTRPRR